MTLPRRQFLQVAGAAAGACAWPRFARALDYPTRPVHVIVGFTAGGGTDVLARQVAQWLSDRMGQPFIVENRSGAGSNIATEAVTRASADGYMLLMINTTNAINVTLYDSLSFDFVRDIAPVAGILRFPNVMVVNPAFPAATVPEFIAYAKAHPGKINMASAGNGGSPHVAGELFKMMANVDMLHVPYRGASQALTDLIAGQVQVMFNTLPESIQHIRSGKLRALAVTGSQRSKTLPDLPIVGDFVPGYEASSWQGIGAPRTTGAEIIDKLNKEISAALADPVVTARFAHVGGEVMPGSPGDFSGPIAQETAKWAKVVKFSGARPD